MCDVWQHGIDDLLIIVEEGFLAKMAPKNWQHGVSVSFAETAALKLASRKDSKLWLHVSHIREEGFELS